MRIHEAVTFEAQRLANAFDTTVNVFRTEYGWFLHIPEFYGKPKPYGKLKEWEDITPVRRIKRRAHGPPRIR